MSHTTISIPVKMVLHSIKLQLPVELVQLLTMYLNPHLVGDMNIIHSYKIVSGVLMYLTIMMTGPNIHGLNVVMIIMYGVLIGLSVHLARMVYHKFNLNQIN